jgi:hypothetical protein
MFLLELARSQRYRVDPELAVEITEHAVATAHGMRAATTFMTRGLPREVLFTWCGPRLIPTPTAGAISALRKLAGYELAPGGWFDLGAGALLANVGLVGFVFVPAMAMPGVTPPEGALHAIAVTADELGAPAPGRVIARLGLRFGRFPCPPWSMPRMAVARAAEPSVLARTRRVAVPGLSVALENGTLEVTVPDASRQQLDAALADPGDGIVIIAAPDPRADAQLAWLPGAPRPTVHRREPQRATRRWGILAHRRRGLRHGRRAGGRLHARARSREPPRAAHAQSSPVLTSARCRAREPSSSRSSSSAA